MRRLHDLRPATRSIVIAILLLAPAAGAVSLPANTPLTSNAPWLAWNVQTAVTTGSIHAGFAVDSRGLGHIVTMENDPQLHYVWDDGSKWNDVPMSIGYNGAGWSSLAYDSGGVLHAALATLIGLNGSLLYATLKPDNSWAVEVVQTGAGYFGEEAKLTFGASDVPHITYYNEADGHITRHAYKDSTGWHLEIIQSSGSITQDSAIDQRTGTAYTCEWITGDNSQYGNVLFSTRDPTSGTWTSQTLYHAGGIGCGVAVNQQNGDVYVAYTTGGTFNVKLATLHNGTWLTQDAWTGGHVLYLSLTTDSRGRPHMAFWLTNGDLLYGALDETGAWETETVDYGDTGATPVIRTDATDHPHIAYVHFDNLGGVDIQPKFSISVAEPIVADAMRIAGVD